MSVVTVERRKDIAYGIHWKYNVIAGQIVSNFQASELLILYISTRLRKGHNEEGAF